MYFIPYSIFYIPNTLCYILQFKFSYNESGTDNKRNI